MYRIFDQDSKDTSTKNNWRGEGEGVIVKKQCPTRSTNKRDQITEFDSNNYKIVGADGMPIINN